MSEHDLFWRYDDLSELITQLPSEEIALYFAENDNDYIVFIASLHEIKDYPQEMGNTTVLGPGVVRKGRLITVNGQVFGAYPYKEGERIVLGPNIFKYGELVSADNLEYHRICGKSVADLPDGRNTVCWLPIGHHSNLHEDRDGKTRYV